MAVQDLSGTLFGCLAAVLVVRLLLTGIELAGRVIREVNHA